MNNDKTTTVSAAATEKSNNAIIKPLKSKFKSPIKIKKMLKLR